LHLTWLQKEKEDLAEISDELELVDEEEKVPYVFVLFFLGGGSFLGCSLFCKRIRSSQTGVYCPSDTRHIRYQVGDCFIALPQPQVLKLVESSTESIDAEVEELKTRLEGVQEEMGELKKALYGRFGRSINLET